MKRPDHLLKSTLGRWVAPQSASTCSDRLKSLQPLAGYQSEDMTIDGHLSQCRSRTGQSELRHPQAMIRAQQLGRLFARSPADPGRRASMLSVVRLAPRGLLTSLLALTPAIPTIC